MEELVYHAVGEDNTIRYVFTQNKILIQVAIPTTDNVFGVTLTTEAVPNDEANLLFDLYHHNRERFTDIIQIYGDMIIDQGVERLRTLNILLFGSVDLAVAAFAAHSGSIVGLHHTLNILQELVHSPDNIPTTWMTAPELDAQASTDSVMSPSMGIEEVPEEERVSDETMRRLFGE